MTAVKNCENCTANVYSNDIDSNQGKTARGELSPARNANIEAKDNTFPIK